MRDVKLPSGATLQVAPAPFAQAKALYQAVLAELKTVPFSLRGDVAAMLKDVVCSGFSSPLIDARLTPCLERCLYVAPGQNPQKIDAETFEPVERRQDYMDVLVEVVKENIGPFGKSLYAEYRRVTEALGVDSLA